MCFHPIAKIVASVRCEVFKMSKVSHLTMLLPLITSQFQMENANPLLKFMLQKISNDILKANLVFTIYVFVPKIYNSCSIISFKMVFTQKCLTLLSLHFYTIVGVCLNPKAFSQLIPIFMPQPWSQIKGQDWL